MLFVYYAAEKFENTVILYYIMLRKAYFIKIAGYNGKWSLK